MPALLHTLLHQILLSMPLFILIALGWMLVRWRKWPDSITEALNRVVFKIALPAMLFRLMSDFGQSPPVDARLLIAFFGSCLIVFVLGRVMASRLFKLDGISGSVFALGGIFSNNVMLGLPIATVMLGEKAIPSVALVLVFNGLILWTLATVSVEWVKHGALNLKGFGKTAISVLKNPLIIAILSGTLFSLTGIPLPQMIDKPVSMLGTIAVPLALVALGMSLAAYKVKEGLRESYAICLLKLIVQPLVIWGLAVLLGLPPLESKVVVLLGSMSVGINVYLMSQQFNALTGPAATSMLLSTVFSAVTTPLLLMLMDLA
ncbi:AEC family transporter [Erwinia sp. QL-Z3]|jgi:predicted permease|uniref:AEC family transporter n=1 Tax=Erwinia sp. QL-Z3 TaxID=2547962 RepID=UPI0010714878|nr:AEC family transporter [Erwinia sp. QL-Z3]QBR51654.1 AEC family transporter [Erwinia sp. QL-Z3]